MKLKAVMTIEEAAKAIRLETRELQLLIDMGAIRPIRLGGINRIRIARQDLLDFLKGKA